MYIPKRYGQSKTEECPFCGKPSMARNSQDMAVCADHKNAVFQEIRCTCGSWLEMKKSKFGNFFVCDRCGTVSMKKALEIKALTEKQGRDASGKPKQIQYSPRGPADDVNDAFKQQDLRTTTWQSPSYASVNAALKEHERREREARTSKKKSGEVNVSEDGADDGFDYGIE